ncbi:hypothetical protein SAMN05421855_10620 [Ulvibacter litoralis]|uniref:Uncharacterized protein n=1 Tax=Ulvibacter litoralis TaxID=227084 RepID=A0A1G7II62_9FLAO|nr:hypothetical protein SAMN05421855_10620 [Ulvibacter litoralis]
MKSELRIKVIGVFGIFLILINVIGLYYIHGYYSPSGIIANNVLTFNLSTKCDSVDRLNILYESSRYNLEESVFNIKFDSTNCKSLKMNVIDGVGSLNDYSNSDLKSLERQLKNLEMYDNSRWVYTGLRFNVNSEIDSYGSSGIERIGFAEYKFHARLFIDIPHTQYPPTVTFNWDSKYKVNDFSPNIQKELSYGGGNNYYKINSAKFKERTFQDIDPGDKNNLEGYYFGFEITDIEKERKKTMYTIIFSTLIGVGVSIFLEAMLSVEILRRFSSTFKKTKQEIDENN